MRDIWQMAAGEPRRNYAPLFLAHDVVFMGPGRYGPWDEAAYRPLINDGRETGNKVGQIRQLAEGVQDGDIVLLRQGYEVTAIGVVAPSPYQWLETFDDVFGWDLQHTRRVIWQEHLAPQLARLQQEAKLFANRKQIPTLTRVKEPAILALVEPLLDRLQQRPPRALPAPPPPPLTLEQLGEQLFARGVPNDSVDRVVAVVQRQRRLLRWYEVHGRAAGRPTEHEVVAHVILPLLLALGWSEQLLAVEWRKIDLAAFWRTPTTAEHCVLVCEAKGMDHGLEDVLDQPSRYVGTHALDGCAKIVVTDGARLYIYTRQQASWGETPAGYLNLRQIRTNHLAPAGTNVVDTLVALTPAGAARPLGANGEAGTPC